MTTLALASRSKSTLRSPLFSSVQSLQAKKRWLHQTAARQAIMMPAMSPFMTEGTIARWQKKEGEAFSAGDVLLQIESDIAVVDVEAESPGILGKILLPDGSTNVPVEQVIALVVKDDRELTKLSAQAQAQARALATPPYNPIPSPPSRRASTPLQIEHFNQPLMPSTHRPPSLFELHTMSHSHHRGITMKHARSSSLTIVPPSPQTSIQTFSPTILLSASKIPTFHCRKAVENECGIDEQNDGATIRRMIVSNLVHTPTSAPFHPISTADKCDTKAYFDGLL